MGGRPEEPGEQGTRKDEGPIKQHGSTRIMAAKDVGGHDCLLPGNLTRPGCSPAMVLAVNSLQLLD